MEVKNVEKIRVKKIKFEIIKNSVDYDKYKFNEAIRTSIRKELSINDDCCVLGHIGRMAYVKNHSFLIDVFNNYHKINTNSKLLLVGDGELKKDIIQKINDLHLDDCVIITGFKSNPYDYMQAMDILLLPSLYEGLPMVLIEAQVNGLKCLVSDKVSSEAKITPSITYLPLDDCNLWVSSINNDSKRVENYNYIKKSGFLLDDLIIKLIKIYGGNDETKN